MDDNEDNVNLEKVNIRSNNLFFKTWFIYLLKC